MVFVHMSACIATALWQRCAFSSLGTVRPINTGPALLAANVNGREQSIHFVLAFNAEDADGIVSTGTATDRVFLPDTTLSRAGYICGFEDACQPSADIMEVREKSPDQVPLMQGASVSVVDTLGRRLLPWYCSGTATSGWNLIVSLSISKRVISWESTGRTRQTYDSISTLRLRRSIQSLIFRLETIRLVTLLWIY
jgi:hypothetical protein